MPLHFDKNIIDRVHFSGSVSNYTVKISEKIEGLCIIGKKIDRVVTNLKEFHSNRLKLTLKEQLPQVTFRHFLKLSQSWNQGKVCRI